MSYGWNLVERIRREDARIDVVVRAFLAQRLSLTGDDLDLLPDGVVDGFLTLPSTVVMVLGAQRLLEHVDAVVARAHPVDVDHHEKYAVAEVLTDDDEVLHVRLDYDGLITLDHEVDPCRRELSLDDAESLAYALLRLVKLGRTER